MSRVEALEESFRRVASGPMAGLPLCNTALHVEAVGFHTWEGKLLGVLVTPWAINLILLPDADPAYRALGPDERQTWLLPAGELEFLGGQDLGCGSFQSCSLLSPTFELADQAAALEMARGALDALVRSARPALSRRGFLTGRPQD